MESVTNRSEIKIVNNYMIDSPICEKILNINPDSEFLYHLSNEPDFSEQIEHRKKFSKSIIEVFNCLSRPTKHLSDALIEGEITEIQAVELYDSISCIVDNPEYKRLLLYLPFEILSGNINSNYNDELKQSIANFNFTYVNNWYDLLDIHDIRANFVDGDVLEESARPGDPPRVVKAAHLIPWLVKNNMIQIDEVIKLTQIDNHVLQRSIIDTLPILDNLGLLNISERQLLLDIEDKLPVEQLQTPLYITENRKQWLESLNNESNQLKSAKNTNHANLQDLCGSFSYNISKMPDQINGIKNKLPIIEGFDDIHPVVLVGGSRIKGYGTEESDVDICIFTKPNITNETSARISETLKDYNLNMIQLDYDDNLIDPPEKWIHEVFNCAWIGDKNDAFELQQKLAISCFGNNDSISRTRCIERLEQDLLQYRLMHKGYQRHCQLYSDRLPDDYNIDGQSAFYDSGYRQVATRLFVDKIFLPKI